MGDWIGHGATPNNWRSVGTDLDSGQKSSVTSEIQPVHWALAGSRLQGKVGSIWENAFQEWGREEEGGKKNCNKHHLLNLTSRF